MEKATESEFKKQMNLQQLANEKRQMMNERILKKMQTIFFPKNKLSDRWRQVTTKAMMSTIPIVNKTSLIDFIDALKAVTDPKGNINLNQFQVLSNSLDTAPPASLGLTPQEYIEASEEVMRNVAEWNKLLEMVNKDVTIEVEKEISMKAVAMQKEGGLTSAKAEA